VTAIDRQYVQTPVPGSRQVFMAGDVLTLSLRLPEAAEGEARLRTNLGLASVRRREVIDHVRRAAPILARDWHDLPMERTAPDTFSVRVPLCAPGHFEAKTLFIPAGLREPVWPEGPNLHIKVEPAHTVAANTIYTAFVRQFREGAERRGTSAEAIASLDEDGYTVIPRSGKFRNLIARLDFIVGKLGFRVIQLLPIFPTPTTYARMGRYGSPFASLDFMAVDPSLADFDKRTTPLDQFVELADAVHARHAHLYLDVPINHTGWASWLQLHHPEWFVRDHDDRFRSPGAWGVTWEDLSELDYDHRPLWEYMAEVFLFWCRQGVDGFRCDAGYMVPLPVWEFITARVREVFPDTVFLLEGLGGKLEAMEALLARGGLNWAYSELFQTFDRHALEHYIPACADTSATRGLLVHFAETHDNNRLASVSHEHARMRTALSALASVSGGFGITNGVEWFATAKVDVHGAPPLNWDAAANQVEAVQRLNAVLRAHPAFRHGARIEAIPQQQGNAIVVRRTAPDGDSHVLVCVNTDPHNSATVRWTGDGANTFMVDLLTGESRDLVRQGNTFGIVLPPSHAVCLTPNVEELHLVTTEESAPLADRGRVVEQQRLRAKALALVQHCAGHGKGMPDGLDAAALSDRLAVDPDAFCAECSGSRPGVSRWCWPADRDRCVMVPPNTPLLVRLPHAFNATLVEHGQPVIRETSLRTASGEHFALFLPRDTPAQHAQAVLELVVSGDDAQCRTAAPVLFLAEWDNIECSRSCSKTDLLSSEYCGLLTNGRGAMLQANAAWAKPWSQYDALLAANLHPDFPVDRQVLFTRCRGWVVYQGYSSELGPECLVSFSVETGRALRWTFAVPVGCGATIRLEATAHLVPGANRTIIRFRRLPPLTRSDSVGPTSPPRGEVFGRRSTSPPGGEVGPTESDRVRGGDGAAGGTPSSHELPADHPVELVLRPDIEDRSFHDVTKAYQGAEDHFSRAVHAGERGFSFSPGGGHCLKIETDAGGFSTDPEWTYQVPHPYEGDRGLDGAGDLFSPGYFTCRLEGGQALELVASAETGGEVPGASTGVPDIAVAERPPRVLEVLREAIADFIVKRDDSLTVIAGYPWFLDWGRDTLICLRGIVAAGYRDEARDVLTQFARFERDGTLPNMIRGNDDSNRDTSDAPLWFFVACADLLDAEGSDAFLDADRGGRTIRDVLYAVADGYTRGTPNGIRVDPDSGLVFSPSHYTWMDTNHPAGTPREGYPIEIQALWFAAQRLLARMDEGGHWAERAQQTADSIQKYYVLADRGFLSDCLHAAPGTPARDAVADDALRSNQLLALTLGAVTSEARCAAILCAGEELLVPGAIRSLADRPVAYELPVDWRGQRLNDPARPYWGRYSGDEDTRRKPAYHNGTAWTWPFPSHAEALFMTHGERARSSALALLGSSSVLLNTGCIGQIPEILEGNAPHAQKGCWAQAWGVTELYRVAAMLSAQ